MNINSISFDSVKRRSLSVVIPFYNEINLIGHAVDSIISQFETDIDMQIIICNDGIIPNELIKSKCRNNNFLNVVSNNSNKGPGGARNTAIANASGDVIAFLDADDIWLPGKLKAQFAAIDMGATFVATAYRFDTCQTVVQPPVSIDKPLDIFLRRGIGTSTVMITRALLADLRFKDIRFAQDIDYWYALARSPHFRYAAVNVCLVEYSTGGSTKNKWVQLQYLHKVLRINDVPWLQHTRVLTSYVLAGVYNHYIKRLFA
jgi:glycosyltransferase involved in cell wall biosynthesis